MSLGAGKRDPDTTPRCRDCGSLLDGEPCRFCERWEGVMDEEKQGIDESEVGR